MVIEKASSMGRSRTKANRTCIIVLGSHRSGTSALTRCLNLLGAALPREIIGPTISNEAGHWEPTPLVYLNDKMLKEAGSRWNDWRQFDVTTLGPERLSFYKSEIKRIIFEEFSNEPLFVLKDPRICRFVALYEEILKGMNVGVRYIHIVRNPLAVSASLKARDNINERLSGLIWLRHVLDVDAAVKTKPNSILIYDMLLKNWRREISGVGADLNLEWPLSIEEVAIKLDQHFRRELRHHSASLTDLKVNDPLQAWLRQTYGAFLALRLNRTDKTALQVLQSVQIELKKSELIFGSLMLELITAQNEFQDLNQNLSDLRDQTQSFENGLFAMLKALSNSSDGFGQTKNYSLWNKLVGRNSNRNISDVQIVQNSLLFDRDWYKAQNPDVVQANMEPAKHYCDFGADEGRQPGPFFDGAWYLRQYQDVSTAKLNPLVHFMKFGWREGRNIRMVISGRIFRPSPGENQNGRQ